jgi:hypothetical protein
MLEETSVAELTINQLARAAHQGLDAFVEAGGAHFGDNMDGRLADFLAALRHLTDECGSGWEQLLEKADDLYKVDKLVNSVKDAFPEP